MGATEITLLAKAFQDYGPWVLVILLGAAIIAMWKRINSIQDARLADYKDSFIKSMEVDKDQTHAQLQAVEALKALERRVEMMGARP
jgi:hypothetical protein